MDQQIDWLSVYPKTPDDDGEGIITPAIIYCVVLTGCSGFVIAFGAALYWLATCINV